MKTKIELEDTFGDIVGKARRGNSVDANRLSSSTGIGPARLEQLLADKAQPSDDEARSIAAALHLDAAKLADSGAQRWYPSPFDPPPYLLHQINAPHPSNGYFLMLRDAKLGAFVDPAGIPSNIIETFKQAQIEPQYILLTHKHADHSDALASLRRAFPAARPVIHELDAIEVGESARGALGIQDGERLPFGDSDITMVYTPGHTDGSSCFIYKGAIFTGDTMFAGSIGRTNGPRSSYGEHLANIRSKILSLPEATVVLPGHGPPSTVGQELAHNPFFMRD